MAYKIPEITKPPAEWGSLLTGMFGCYDTIGDPDFDMSRDETLHERSAYEFIREQLTDAQRVELDQVDAFWRAHAAEFNADFATLHFQEDKQTALTGFVEDENGETPAIPASHWWWRPIEEEKHDG